ncbi:hypothetical protein IGB42_03944 [Andreprevotia sp. IGB-42]|uniref:hypothetical protein n=1 Tax=Andreprevotia sp. IGB-42 TaxID=2497473 RepID=UPI0013596FB7|nr:hypothetical protein [Andreprevotia sp. IGB-42]KAF0811558.1 hypothetical protein IGB42_03944 [Andreprevotia sp. IGB-42]
MTEQVDEMSYRRVNGREVNLSQWPTPDEGAFVGKKRIQYFSRKKAILLYLSGASDSEIKEQTAIGAKQVYRLIRERCLETHPDGLVYGWRALVPFLRVHPFKRIQKIKVDAFGYGAAGALQLVLDLNPELRKKFEARILPSKSGVKLRAIKRSIMNHCIWFNNELRALGYEARNEWPFNTQTLGYSSISRYVKNVLNANPAALADSVGGPDLVRKMKSGDGTQRPVTKFMQRIEMDAHKLDGRFCVLIPLIGGGYQEKIVYRLWVIVALEVMSRVVVGYYFSMRREVSKDDVLRALKRGLSRWVPREVTFSDTPYQKGAGLLSVLGSEYVGLAWDETSVDGALAETSKHVRDILIDGLGSMLLDPSTSFSQRRTKDDRPFIEAFFRNLAGNGFQGMSNTTGAKPKDKAGRNPEAVAINSRFQYEYAEELIDVLIANYNATPHRGIGNRTPLEYAFCGVGEALFNMPLRKRGQPLLQRVDCQLVGVFSEVSSDAVTRGGQQAAPFHLKMAYGRSVAALRVFACGRS